MLTPRKTRWRKAFKGRIHGSAGRCCQIAHGRYGLQALQANRLTSRQIEAARQAMTRYIKRGGRIWIRVFPHLPVSKKPVGLKMGKGKGDLDHYAARIRPGTILFEMDGVSQERAKEAMRLAGHKLPVKSKFVVKGDL